MQLLPKLKYVSVRWMTWNKLKLNGNKTELLVLTARNCPILVCDEVIRPSSLVKNLGILFDSSLDMEQYVTNVCKSGFYHLRNISRIRKHLTQQNAETLMHAFISSRLDFCNSLLYGLPKYLIDRIQSVQNAAARIVSLGRCKASWGEPKLNGVCL